MILYYYKWYLFYYYSLISSFLCSQSSLLAAFFNKGGTILFFLFTYLFLAALGLCCFAWAFSSCGEQGLLSCCAWASHCGGFSCCKTQALGARASTAAAGAQAQLLQYVSVGSIVVAHKLSHSMTRGISQTRDRTHVPCCGRRIPTHGVIREVPSCLLIKELQM